MTVYVIQGLKDRDFSPALKYSSPIVQVCPFSLLPVTTEKKKEELYKFISEKMKGFSPYSDYILLSGAPDVIAMVIAMVAAKFSSFWVLKWDREGSYYYPIKIDIGERDDAARRIHTSGQQNEDSGRQDGRSSRGVGT